MTEKDVQKGLWFDLKSHSIICPNYTPAHWFECDVFSVTKAGYFVEHEIKLSVSDFKKDASKSKSNWKTGERNKHAELALASEYGPKNFWFVTSQEIADQVEIPEWAGHKVATTYRSYTRIRVLKKAPNLHDKKILPSVVEHVKGVFYWRFWNERIK